MTLCIVTMMMLKIHGSFHILLVKNAKKSNKKDKKKRIIDMHILLLSDRTNGYFKDAEYVT